MDVREPNQRGLKGQTAKKLRIPAGSEEGCWRFYFPLRRTVCRTDFAKDFAKKFCQTACRRKSLFWLALRGG